MVSIRCGCGDSAPSGGHQFPLWCSFCCITTLNCSPPLLKCQSTITMAQSSLLLKTEKWLIWLNVQMTMKLPKICIHAVCTVDLWKLSLWSLLWKQTTKVNWIQTAHFVVRIQAHCVNSCLASGIQWSWVCRWAGRQTSWRLGFSFVDCYRQRVDTCQERGDHQSE